MRYGYGQKTGHQAFSLFRSGRSHQKGFVLSKTIQMSEIRIEPAELGGGRRFLFVQLQNGLTVTRRLRNSFHRGRISSDYRLRGAQMYPPSRYSTKGSES